MEIFFPPRLYRGLADLEAMKRLQRRGMLAESPGYFVHPGDIQWWLFYPPIGEDLTAHTFVWDAPDGAGEILAWMLVDPSWPSFELFVEPGIYASSLHGEMLAWAEEEGLRQARAGAENLHKLWVAEGDAFQKEWLERRGFREGSGDIFFLRSLAEPVPTDQPTGWAIRRCRGLEEVEQRARAQYGAFQSKSPFDRYLERWTRFMQSEAYAGALDLVAVNADGKIGASSIAAFCIAWLDEPSCRGHLEPVGTHPDFQRQGLARAVLLEALRRMQILGMASASVCTPQDNAPAQALYASVGFRPAQRLGLYQKKASAA